MRTIHRANLPEVITRNAKEYRLDIAATHAKVPPTDSVCIMVLQGRLKGELDLHGKPYKPRRFIFTPKIMQK